MLKLTKDKKIISDSHGVKEVTPDHILGYVFSEPVGEIDGWTFRDLMEFIAGTTGNVLGEMAWCHFNAFYREMQKPVTKSDEPDSVQYILVSRRIDLYKGEINEYADVCGGNDTITDEMINADFEATGVQNLSNRYAIEFTPVNELADKPIRIDDRFIVRKDIMDDQEMPIVFEARKPFYLLDIIWAILWEISFAGSPEERDEQVEELNRRVESIKDGTAKLIPAEEVFARLRERLDGLREQATEEQGKLEGMRQKLAAGEDTEKPSDPA